MIHVNNLNWEKCDNSIQYVTGDILLLQHTITGEYLVELVGARYVKPKECNIVGISEYITESIDFTNYSFFNEYIKNDLKNMFTDNLEKDSVTVTKYMKVNMGLVDKTTEIYNRKTETNVSLNTMAEILYHAERKMGLGSSYAHEVLENLKDLGYQASHGKSIQDLQMIYQSDRSYTEYIESEFEKANSGQDDFFDVKNDYLKLVSSNFLSGLISLPKIPTQVFKYWFKKYVLDKNPEYFNIDDTNVSDLVKEVISEIWVENK